MLHCANNPYANWVTDSLAAIAKAGSTCVLKSMRGTATSRFVQGSRRVAHNATTSQCCKASHEYDAKQVAQRHLNGKSSDMHYGECIPSFHFNVHSAS